MQPTATRVSFSTFFGAILFTLGAISVLAGCGGEVEEPPTPPTSHFDGVWAGSATVSIGGESDRTYEASITGATVSDVAVRLTGICPDATAVAEGIGLDVFSWQGVIECRPTFLGGCFIAFEYRSGTATVVDDRLEMTFTGIVRDSSTSPGACPPERMLSMSFRGVKS